MSEWREMVSEDAMPLGFQQGAERAAEVHIELADPEGDLLREIADPVMSRHDVRLTYRLALRSQDRVDWGKVNRAIIERWSVTTLKQIKAWAWKAS